MASSEPAERKGTKLPKGAKKEVAANKAASRAVIAASAARHARHEPFSAKAFILTSPAAAVGRRGQAGALRQGGQRA